MKANRIGLVTGVAVVLAAFAHHDCRADLVSWWKFEGNANDFISSNNGTLHGGTSFTSGFVGLGIHTNEPADGVNVNDSPSLALTHSLTIRANICLTSLPTDPLHWAMIFFRGDDRSALDPYFLAVDPAGQLVFHVESLNSAEEVSALLPLNRFVTVMATLDDASGAMRLYVDDVLVSAKTTSVRPFRDLDPTKKPGIGIGGHGSYPSDIGTIPFHGYIDELKVFNSAEPPESFLSRLLLQNQTNHRVAILAVSGTGFSSSATIYPTLPANWRVAAAADFNHDGWTDIVVQNTQTRAVSILYMKRLIVQSSDSLRPILPANWHVAAAGDFNGDGKPDLLAQNTVTQRVSVLTFTGQTITSSTPLSQGLLPNWFVVGAADFNADGKTDILVQNTVNRQIRILTANGATITGGSLLDPTLPANWYVGAVGDFNDDGKPDIVVQNSDTKRISVLTLKDLNISSSFPLAPNPPAEWALAGPK